MSRQAPGYQRIFAELKRRRVFRVMAVYGIAGFVLLQIADLAVPALLLPDWTYRLCALVLLLGLPVALILAWAFEMTPEGVRRTADATEGELTGIITAPRAKRWPSGVLALVGMTALLAGTWYVGRQWAPTADSDVPTAVSPVSIAVLPFVDMSPNKDQEYFSEGISEELLNLLTKIPQLRVASRTSAFSFKGKEVQLKDVARELDVAHVLEGSVRKAGNQVRITAQLIDARSDTHLWSQTWDRQLEDIFVIQDEIAADVVEQLKVTLLDETPTVAETDPEAYALFLQARQLFRQGAVESVEQSVGLYEEALEIDPEYAAPWAGLANSYIEQVAAIGSGRPVPEGFGLARAAANRALELDPRCAEAYAHLGRIAMLYDGDLQAAAHYLERAHALDPANTDIIGLAAVLAVNLGRIGEAIALGEYVIGRDPVNPAGYYWLGRSYLWAGQLDAAIASFRTALRLSPGRIGAHYFVGAILLLKGEPEDALQAMRQETDEPRRLLGLSQAYHALGRSAESDAALGQAIDRHAESMAYNVAYVMSFRGEADRAFEWLDKAVQYHDAGLSLIAIDVQFANIHDDPRWLPFLDSIGRSPEQLSAIDFQVRLPE